MDNPKTHGLLGDYANAMTIVGLLIERLGGSVTLTKAEIEGSILGRQKNVYVEVHDDRLVLEVIPTGGFPR